MSIASIPEAVAISFASQCDRGKGGEENQSSVLRTTVPLGDFLIVADGIGGYAGGVASRMAVAIFSSCLADMPTFFPPAIAIQEAACRASAEIAAAGAEPDTPSQRMGATVVLALLQQDPEGSNAAIQAWIGHVGNSRAYIVHNGRLRRITRDHSAIQTLLDRNLITPEGARRHPDAFVLTRTLGQEPNVEIELNEVALDPGDTLFLCSDGLWGYVPEDEIERLLADAALSAEEASRALLKLALVAGGHDNVGMQIARLVTAADAAAVVETVAEPVKEPKPTAPFASQVELEPELTPPAKPGAGRSIPEEITPAAEVQSASSPKTEITPEPETEPKPTLFPEFDSVPKFESIDLSNFSVVKMMMILIVTFAGSGALVYSALMQNWFGVDSFFR